MLKFGKYLATSFKLKNIRLTHSNKIVPVELAYDLYGSNRANPPLIILHSLCGNKSNWRCICEQLQYKLNPNRKIFAVDARNHGRSEYSIEHSYEHIAEDVVNFLQNQKIKKACVMGHSMGGRAMMYLALKHPTLVEKAIILDVSPLNTAPPSDIIYSRIMLSIMKNTKFPENLSIGQSRAFAGERMRQLINNEFEINYLLQNLMRNQDKKYSWSLNIDALQNYVNNLVVFPNFLSETKFLNPVLFIAGFKSHYMNPNHWPEIKQIFPHSILSWINSGHLVHIEQPDEIVRLVSDFLNNEKTI